MIGITIQSDMAFFPALVAVTALSELLLAKSGSCVESLALFPAWRLSCMIQEMASQKV